MSAETVGSKLSSGPRPAMVSSPEYGMSAPIPSVVQVSCSQGCGWGLRVQPVSVSTAVMIISKESFFMRKFFIFKTNISGFSFYSSLKSATIGR